MSIATLIVWVLGVVGVCATGYIIWSYAKGLKESPKDMWVLFFYMIIQYVGYAAINPILTLWLSKDCGISDIGAGNYIMAWSILLSMVGMVAGALVDTIGIRRTMVFSVSFLIVSRFFMSVITDPVIVFIVGFLPFAIGFAIVSPVVSVSIKRYTTKEGAALGFGLFYVIMNLAYAIGGWFMDFVRDKYSLRDAAGKIIDENAGMDLLGFHFSTYQMLFFFGLIMTVASAFFIFFIRDGVEISEEIDDEGKKSVKTIIKPVEHHGSGLAAVKGAYLSMFAKIKSAVVEKYFWMFIAILTTTLFVRFIFFHLHYTFPKYGIRVLGEGAKIGNIYGVLNPVLIVFLVPMVASFTKKTKSYTMLVIGSAISSLSCFLAVIPGKVFEGLTNTVLGEIIFIKWLGMADTMEKLMENPPVSEYWSLIFFFLIFTIGEAIWSPRLMQFTAEIAPKGKEGTYIALAILPFFLAKFVVGPMSGLLVNAYVPVDEAGKALASYPDHFMVWVWIGGMALVTPLGLLFFRKVFTKNIEGA
ncbi:MAG TPA: MFS transporter [bacterium]|nr:MFS transporter [bacterium]